MTKSNGGEIGNLIEFEVANRPLVTGTNFPYRKILDSLKVLDATKSLVFDPKNLPYSRIQALRKLAAKEDLGWIKQAKKGDKLYLWIHTPCGGDK